MTIVLEIMPKFYEYIVAAELDENPYTAPPTVTTTNSSLYDKYTVVLQLLGASCSS